MQHGTSGQTQVADAVEKPSSESNPKGGETRVDDVFRQGVKLSLAGRILY